MEQIVPLLSAAAALVLYRRGVRRLVALRHGAPFPRARIACFAGGVAVVLLALCGPIDAYSGASFAVHMTQHLTLMLVAAPLLLLGTPFLVTRQAVPAVARRALDRAVRGRVLGALTFPPVSWLAFVVILWGSHYSRLYEASLEHPAVHALEHALYLGAALLFWYPVIGMGPTRWRLSYPARLLYLFAAAGQNTALGLSLYEANRALYPHYLAILGRAGALADQQNGAVVMWIGGSLAMLIAILTVVANWMISDERAQQRREALVEHRSHG
jgi:putative membrane protein